KRGRQRSPRVVDMSVSVSDHQLHFAGTLDDPSARVRDVKLYVREAGDTSFRETPMALDGGALTAVLAQEMRRGARVDYYVIACGESGEALAKVGGPESPSSVFVEGAPAIVQPPPAVVSVDSPSEDKKSRSVLTEWWFWTAIGVVVVAGA